MKKLLLVTAIAIFGLTNMNAQDIEFGLKSGINFASISGDNASDFDPVVAFSFGAMAEIHISEKFSFQPELVFSGQGFGTGKGEDELVSLNYLNLPLIGKYYLTKKLSLEAGPQIGFLLYAKDEGTNVKDDFKTLDFAANIGLGYKLNNGLNFGARYNFGLSNINDVSGFSNKNKNGTLQVSIGYFF